MRRPPAALFVLALASPALADDWAQPAVNLQQALAASGVSLGGGVTGFGQGLAGGDGVHGVPFGGKADVLLGLDGARLGLWPGVSVSAHFEQTLNRFFSSAIRSASFSDLDRAGVALHPDLPGRAHGRGPQRRVERNGLAGRRQLWTFRLRKLAPRRRDLDRRRALLRLSRGVAASASNPVIHRLCG